MIFKQNKIINNRNKIENFSIAVDKNGNQHLAWMENKNGQYDVVYKFWNGMQWEFLEENVIYTSSQKITYSNILIINNQIKIIYVKEAKNKSRIGCIDISQSNKTIKEYEVDLNIKWITIDKDTTEKQRPYIIAHNGESFYIYKITDEKIVLEGNKNYQINDKQKFEKIKTSNNQDNFAIVINNTDDVEFNFFNYKDKSWANNNFIKLNSSIDNNIIEFDIKGIENTNKIGIVLLNHQSKEEIKYIETDKDGNENFLDDVIVFSRETSLNVPSGFYVAGYNNVSISYDQKKPMIFALGTQNICIKYELSWKSNVIKSPVKINQNIFIFNSYNICAISNQNIYFFILQEEEINPENISISLLNSNEFVIADWNEGEFINKKTTSGVHDNTVGDIFLDSKQSKIIFFFKFIKFKFEYFFLKFIKFKFEYFFLKFKFEYFFLKFIKFKFEYIVFKLFKFKFEYFFFKFIKFKFEYFFLFIFKLFIFKLFIFKLFIFKLFIF
jgi:hypothetical protein